MKRRMLQEVWHSFWEGEAPAEPRDQASALCFASRSCFRITFSFYAMRLFSAQRELRPPKSRATRPARKALSLLEVILALAILAGAMAVLGQVSFIGLRNAREARDMTQAELLCESKLAEITAGIVPSDPVSNAYFDSQFDPGSNTSNDPDATAWLYSIESELIDDTGLLAVRVTVVQDLPPARRPVELSLIRWMVDPDLEASEEDGL